MKLFLVLLACLLLPSSALASEYNQKPETRIVNGTVAPPGSWQSQALVRPGGSALCGGTVIRAVWVLTAGHCVSGFNNSSTTVATGTHSLFASGEVISKAYLHPNFEAYDLRNDIALLRLSSPTSAPAALLARPADRQFYPEGTPAYTAGWGQTCFGEDCPVSAQLLQTTLPMVSYPDCDSVYAPYLSPHAICAGGGDTDACQGDSGGPLEVSNGTRRILIGVVSWGFECAREGFPGVYTEVASYNNWIGSYIVNKVAAPKKVSFRKYKKVRVRYNDTIGLATVVKVRSSNNHIVRVARSTCSTLRFGESCFLHLRSKSKHRKGAKLVLSNRAGTKLAVIKVHARR